MKNKLLRVAGMAIVLLSVLLTGYCQETAPAFQLRIRSDKEIVRPGDNIEFVLDFKNISSEDSHIYLENTYRAYLFTLTNAEGKEQSAVITVIYEIMWDVKNYKLVKKGEEYRWKITATLRNTTDYLLDFGDSSIMLANPGIYRVRATYWGWDGITTDAEGRQIALSEKLGLKNVFVDTLVSNTIAIELK